MPQSRKMTPGPSSPFCLALSPEMCRTLAPQSVDPHEDISNIWKLVRNARFQDPPWTPETRTHISARALVICEHFPEGEAQL